MFGTFDQILMHRKLNKDRFSFEKAERKMVVNSLGVGDDLVGVIGEHLGKIFGCDILFLTLNQRN